MRRATEEDADAIAKLDMELFPDNCFNERTLKYLIDDEKSWVVYIDDELVGYLIGAVEGPLIDIVRIGVRGNRQSSGIGSMMLTASLEDSTHSILTVQKNNKGAIKLYKRFGFKVTGSLCADKEESWVMSNQEVHRE